MKIGKLIKRLNRKFYKDSAWLLAMQILVTFFGAVGTLLIARFLEPSGYGRFSAIMAYGLSLISLFSLGLGGAVVRYTAHARKKSEKLSYLLTYTKIIIFIAFVVALFSFLLLKFKFSLSSSLLAISIFLFVFIILKNYLMDMFRALQEFNKYSLLLIFESLFKYSFAIILILLGYGLFGALAGFFIGYLLLYLIFKFRLKEITFLHSLKKRFDFGVIKKILKFGLWTSLAGVAATLMGKIDVIMLTFFTSDAEIGHYNASLSIIMACLGIVAFVVPSLVPRMSELYSRNKKNLVSFYKKLTFYSIFVTIPAGIALFFFADYIPLILGNKYAPSIFLIKLLCPIIIFTFVSIGASPMLYSLNRPDIVAKVKGFTLFLNIILNLILIPIYGVIGAAIATSSSWLMSMALLAVNARILVKRLG